MIQRGGRGNKIWRMRNACLITKATCTLRYVILLFHRNNAFADAPQCYVTRTLSLSLWMKETSQFAFTNDVVTRKAERAHSRKTRHVPKYDTCYLIEISNSVKQAGLITTFLHSLPWFSVLLSLFYYFTYTVFYFL
jgi:hypothetical protein